MKQNLTQNINKNNKNLILLKIYKKADRLMIDFLKIVEGLHLKKIMSLGQTITFGFRWALGLD